MSKNPTDHPPTAAALPGAPVSPAWAALADQPAQASARGDRLADPALARELRQALSAALGPLARGERPLLRPPTQIGWQAGAQELFLQLSGWTQFTFPQGGCHLRAGQALLLPPHLQHAETVGADAHGADGAGGGFRNLLVYAEGTALSVHLADEAQPGQPGILHLEVRQLPRVAQMAQQLLAASQRHDEDRQAGDDVDGGTLDDWRARALVSATLAQALQLLEQPASEHRDEPAAVARTRLLVKNQLGDAELSVRGLALHAACSADYLSHLFHRHGGETLIGYITRLRMERALQLLGSSRMAVKEVAWACGYNSPGYFIQTFRRLQGLTPGAWRQSAAGRLDTMGPN
jgi:AraC-like DNA-binding protein